MSALLRRSLCLFGNNYIKSSLGENCVWNRRWSTKYYLHTSSFLCVSGQEIKMPSLSPTMTEGRIIKWLKKEGDPIRPGDVLCEIQTDKAVMVFETEEEGVLARIIVGEDKDIKVGNLIALMVNEDEDWREVEVPAGQSADIETTEKISLSQQESPSSSSEEFVGTEVKMPSLSPTMTEGTIIRWLKKEGDKISPGDILCEIQTDKAVMVYETEDEGILAKILVPDNTPDVKIGTLIALIVEEGEDWMNVKVPQQSSTGVAEKPVPAGDKLPVHTHPVVRKFGPAARFLLDLYKIDVNNIVPSGRTGNILKKDILRFISDNNLLPKPPSLVPLPSIKKEKLPEMKVSKAQVSIPELKIPSVVPSLGYIDIEISNIRRIIAKRLTQSKVEIPHGYSVIETKVDNLLNLREELKSSGYNVSVNDFVIKAVASALKECPFANTLYVGDQIIPAQSIDISVAVATPNGLITPIVKSADSKNLIQISEEIRELAQRARKGSLQPHEFQGGSFTISNLGMFGIREFSAIINPPQCGILAVGCNRPVMFPDGSSASLMSCTLSFDERSIDDVGAAEFLGSLQYYLHNPSLLLINQNRKSITSNAV